MYKDRNSGILSVMYCAAVYTKSPFRGWMILVQKDIIPLDSNAVRSGFGQSGSGGYLCTVP